MELGQVELDPSLAWMFYGVINIDGWSKPRTDPNVLHEALNDDLAEIIYGTIHIDGRRPPSLSHEMIVYAGREDQRTGEFTGSAYYCTSSIDDLIRHHIIEPTDPSLIKRSLEVAKRTMSEKIMPGYVTPISWQQAKELVKAGVVAHDFTSPGESYDGAAYYALNTVVEEKLALLHGRSAMDGVRFDGLKDYRM